MKAFVLSLVLVLTAAAASAESVGTRVMEELVSESTFFWDTTAHASPTVAYASVLLSDAASRVSVKSRRETDDFFSANPAFDARVYFVPFLSSELARVAFETGFLMLVR